MSSHTCIIREQRSHSKEPPWDSDGVDGEIETKIRHLLTLYPSICMTLSPLQQALSSHPIIPSELLMGALPVEPMHSLDSTSDNEREALSQIQSSMAQADTLASLVDGCVELSPLPPDSEEALEHRSSRPVQETPNTASASFSPINQGAPSQPETPPAPVPGHQPQPLIQPPVLQASLPLMQNFDLVPQTQSEIQPQAHVLEAFVSNIQTQASVPHAHPELVVLDQDQVFNLSQHQHHPTYQQHDALVTPASLSSGAEEPAVQQHSLSSRLHHFL